MNSTQSQQYADYLIQHQKSFKGKILQLPYQTHLRALNLGKTLDVGCGAGRNLNTLSRESLGLDHNDLLVKSCNDRGLKALTTPEWEQQKNQYIGSFESILFSHVAEHMTQSQFQNLLGSFLPYLKPQAKVLIICPQELGYTTDSTHVEFMDFQKIDQVFKNLGLKTLKQYSFPFPHFVGKFFAHNEFISLAVKES